MLLTVFMVEMECGRADSLQRHAWHVSRLSRRNHMSGMQGMTHWGGVMEWNSGGDSWEMEC